MSEEYDLARFVQAQDAGGTYSQVLIELRGGRKATHWMWFIFPQIAGLGHSTMAQRYALSGLDEARAYLAHCVLGPRLKECSSIVARHRDRSAISIFGDIDAIKLRSSMTLFWRADPQQPVFAEVLDLFYSGQPDPATDAQLTLRHRSP